LSRYAASAMLLVVIVLLSLIFRQQPAKAAH